MYGEEIKKYSQLDFERLLTSRFDFFLIIDSNDEIVYLPNLLDNTPASFKKIKLKDKVSIHVESYIGEEIIFDGNSLTAQLEQLDFKTLKNCKISLNGNPTPYNHLAIGTISKRIAQQSEEKKYHYLTFLDDTAKGVPHFNCEELTRLLDFFDLKSAVACPIDKHDSLELSKALKKHVGQSKNNLFDILHVDDSKRLRKFLKTISQESEEQSLVIRLQHKDRSYHYTLLRSLPISSSFMSEVIIFFTDIDTSFKQYLSEEHEFFLVTDNHQKILAKGDINYERLKDDISYQSKFKLSDLGLDSSNSLRIEESFKHCYEHGKSTCRLELQTEANDGKKEFILKQFRLSDGQGQALGVISLFKLVEKRKLSLFENLFEQLSDSIILSEPNGNIRFLNNAAKKLLKNIVSTSEAEGFAKFFEKLQLTKLLEAYSSKQFEFTKTERVFFEITESKSLVLQCESKLLNTEESEILLFFVVKDITKEVLSEAGLKQEISILQETYHQLLEKSVVQYQQKKQAKEEVENALLERNILDTFFNANNTASIILDKHFNIRYFNEKADGLIMLLNGIHPEKEKHISNFHLPCSFNRFEKFAREAFKGRQLKMLSTSTIHKNNKSSIYEIVFIPLIDETQSEWDYLACNFLDVSERQERQNQLDLFENVVEHANEGIIVTKADPLHEPGPEIIYVNHGMEKLSGYNANELIGNSPRILQGPKSDRVVLNRIKQALIKGRSIKEEVINYTKLGKPYWVELSITPILDKIGNVSSFVAHQKDITSRKDNEIERSTMIKHLLRQNQELDEFAFITSHNLRAPVARLLGLIDLIKYELEENRIPKELFEHVVSSSNLLDEIIRDLNYILAFKKQIGEKQEIIHFEEKIEKVKFALQEHIKNSDATIICDFESCPSIYSIDSYVSNILEHLIHNAIKYAKRNEAPIVEMRTFYREGTPCFEINDNGIGFPMQVSEKDFKLYRRFHPEIPGKGLGLFLVRSHIEMLRGSLQVKSEENKGTTFTIVFPPDSDQPLSLF